MKNNYNVGVQNNLFKLFLQIFSILKTKYIDFTGFTFVIFIAKIIELNALAYKLIAKVTNNVVAG